MILVERYLFRQLLGPTLLATVALTAVAILSQSLSALDVLVDQSQGPLIFAEVVALALPQLVAMMLPTGVMIAGLITFNRLHTEQEIVICFAGGMSYWRVAAPGIRLAGLCVLVCLALGLWVQPLAFRTLRQILTDARADFASSMIDPGHFTHPAGGLTVYAKSKDDSGLARELFLNQERPNGRSITLTAQEGRFEKHGAAPLLVLRHGEIQEFSRTNVLNFVVFDEYALDLRSLATIDQTVHLKLQDRYLHELFFPDLRDPWERENRGQMAAEGHARLADPLYNLSSMMMALAAVVGGAFSRVGYGRRIAAIGAVALVARILGFAAEAAGGLHPWMNALQYAVPAGTALAAGALLFATRPKRGQALATLRAPLALGRTA